jgi:hypothetical protein
MGFLQLIGGGIDTAGKLQQGKIDAATGETNKRLSEAQGNDALLRGSIEESQYRRHIAQVVGGQKAAFGKGNVAVSGTALNLLSDTAQIGEEDAQTIRNNAAREAWGYRNQASEASRWGANQEANSLSSAGRTLLTAGSQSYGQWTENGGGVQNWLNTRPISSVKIKARRV